MKQQVGLCLGILLYVGSAVSARADYLFTFDKASSGPSLTTSSADQYMNIENYMDMIIGCSGCVTVSRGVAVAQEYNADGNVVGPGLTGASLTLGNSNYAANNNVTPSAYGTDNYISNMATQPNGSGDDQLSQGITITLTKGYTFTGTFSFDYEIFPDISCQQLTASACGGAKVNGHYPDQPDLAFSATGGTTNASQTFWGITPVNGGADGDSTKSPDGSGEQAPQYIGESGNFTLVGVTTLSFQDWPAAIGVDNLKLVSTTPEPRGYAFILGGLMLALFAGTKLRQGLAKSSN
jgi:hypothetical protein